MASLPEIPRGTELEDYVAALLQGTGYFVEKSIIEREQKEILELDIVATRYPSGVPHRQLFEVKSRDWGFADIFKLLGWKTYLGPDTVNEACFIATRIGEQTTIDLMEERFGKFNIDLVAVPDHLSLATALQEQGLIPHQPNEIDHALYRYSFWLERKILKSVKTFRTSRNNLEGPFALAEYLDLINNGTFFIGDLQSRLSALYQAYQQHPKLSMGIAGELDGWSYNPHVMSTGESWKRALSYGEVPEVQAAFYCEHRARLAILKGAVDYVCLERAGGLPPQPRLQPGESRVEPLELPDSFYSAVSTLRSIDEPDKVPVLWQSLLWKWGGFFLTEHLDEERTALAEEVGMPLGSLDKGLRVYEELFPYSNGWWTDLPGTRILKLFPAPFRGIGAQMRRMSAGAENYDPFRSNPILHRNLNQSQGEMRRVMR